MIDATKILTDLRRQAEALSKEYDLDGKFDSAKVSAEDFRNRLETDENARRLAMGAGGVLLLGLLGTKTGRKFTSGVAKTGAVAALGALAYKAWADRKGAGAPVDVSTAAAAGFPTRAEEDPEFALAVLRAMLASAYADGVLDAHEAQRIDEAMDRAGVSAEERALLQYRNWDQAIDDIAAAARSPNHATELYAAAVVAAGDQSAKESEFLVKLADRLGIGGEQALTIRRAADDLG